MNQTHSKQYGPSILPPAPHKAAEAMITIINDLRGVYEEETQALEKSNISSFIKLQDTKLQAARKYEMGITQMLQRKDEMQAVPEKTKNKLRSMQKDFADLALKNKKALERMQKSTERLGEVIRGAAKDVIKNRIATSYSNKGALNTHNRGNVSVGISETA